MAVQVARRPVVGLVGSVVALCVALNLQSSTAQLAVAAVPSWHLSASAGSSFHAVAVAVSGALPGGDELAASATVSAFVRVEPPSAAAGGAGWVGVSSASLESFSFAHGSNGTVPALAPAAFGCVLSSTSTTGVVTSVALVSPNQTLAAMGVALLVAEPIGPSVSPWDRLHIIPGAGGRLPSGWTNVGGPACWTGSNGVAYAAVPVANPTADAGASNAILLFNATDVNGHWSFMQQMWSGSLPAGGHVDTLDFFEAGDQPGVYAALLSAAAPTQSTWMVGTGNTTFTPGSGSGILDYGDALQGLRTYRAADGRRLAVSSLAQGAGAASVLGLPRQITVKSSVVSTPPAQEITALRKSHEQDSVELFANETYGLSGVSSIVDSMELQLQIAIMSWAGSDAAVGVRLSTTASTNVEIEIASVAPATPCNNTPWLNHTDSQAAGYMSWAMPTADPDSCRTACCNDPKCTVYTYTDVQPVLADEALVALESGALPPCTSGKICCWLKTGAASMKPQGQCPECYSGYSNAVSEVVLRVSVGQKKFVAQLGSVPAHAAVPIRIFTDGDILEVFANNGAAVFSTRVSGSFGGNAELFSTGCNANVMVDAWKMQALSTTS